ncbi:MAG: hypothetical protein AB7T49_06955 [Oligoflexales bacterium]
MKRFIVLALMTLSTISMADESMENQAIQTFKDSALVQDEINNVKNNFGLDTIGEIKAIEIDSGCGFAGCDYSVLVIQKLEWRGVNTRTTTVSAVVEIPSHGEPTLKIADIVARNN